MNEFGIAKLNEIVYMTFAITLHWNILLGLVQLLGDSGSQQSSYPKIHFIGLGMVKLQFSNYVCPHLYWQVVPVLTLEVYPPVWIWLSFILVRLSCSTYYPQSNWKFDLTCKKVENKMIYCTLKEAVAPTYGSAIISLCLVWSAMIWHSKQGKGF